MMMNKYKVNFYNDNIEFFVTDSYIKLVKLFETLKIKKGKIIHVLGAPGTGKSTNIFHAIDETNLKVYNVKLNLKTGNESSKEVFNKMIQDLGSDLGVNSKDEIYKKLSSFDSILIADSFHDAHLLNSNVVGFSQWTNKAGLGSFYFYLLCIIEYLKKRKYFKNINLIFQTSWRFNFRDKRYDIFTDFGLLSKILAKVLKIFFVVIEIAYSEEETIEIVKIYIKDARVEDIKHYIKKFGFKPRLICQALEK